MTTVRLPADIEQKLESYLMWPLLALALGMGLLTSCASLASSETLQLSVVSDRDSGTGWQWTREYPRFPGLPAVDGRIQAIVRGETEKFLVESDANRRAREATAGPGEVVPSSPPHELMLRWEPVTLSPEYLSLVLRVYSWTGGAHGDDREISINYDLKAGRFLRLVDVLKDAGDDPLAAVARLAREDLSKRLGTDPESLKWIDSGTEAIPDNYSCFTFDRAWVVLRFPKYSVAPGSAGILELRIPRDLGVDRAL